VVALAMLAGGAAGWWEPVELWWYDALVRRHAASGPTSGAVVLVGITEEDIRDLNTWPPSDRRVADLLTRLLEGQPRAIGLDLYRDIPEPPGTEELGRVLGGDPRIVAVEMFGGGGGRAPAALAGSDQVGFNDIVVDPGGVVRRGLLFLDDGERVSRSLALQVALRYLWQDGIGMAAAPENPDLLKLGATVIAPLAPDAGPYRHADARGYQYLLDFAGGKQPFASYGLSEVLGDGFDTSVFTDRVVLVGVTASSVKDNFYTPWSRGQQEGQQTSGVAFHAFAADQLIRAATGSARFLRDFSPGQEALWVLFWGLLGGAVAGGMRSPLRVAVLGSAGAGVIAATAFLGFGAGLWVPAAAPLAAWGLSVVVGTAYLLGRERRQRGELMQLFSRQVSPEIADAIWAQRDALLDGGRLRSQELTATVIFTDIRGYTAVSEGMSPQGLVDWLNSYMEPLADLISAHGGVVDDYAGDGIKANFGVPFGRTSAEQVRADARNAACCALAMGDTVDRVNRQWSERGVPPAGIRVGVHTGPLVAGAVGSPKRMKYTTVGDTVNTAARLEAYKKDLARDDTCRILVSEATRQLLGEEFPVEAVGSLRLQGKREVVEAYRVLRETGS
jgi:adenylate cyclase